MTVALKAPCVLVDKIALRFDASTQLRMIAGESGVDERDAHAATAGNQMRLLHGHALVAGLYLGIGVAGRQYVVVVQGFGQGHALVFLQLRQQLLARAPIGEREDGAVQMQQVDRPGLRELQVIARRDRAHGAPCAVAHPIGRLSTVLERGAAHVHAQRRNIIRYGDEYESRCVQLRRLAQAVGA